MQVDQLSEMLEDAANELRYEGMEALATAVDVARERLAGSTEPASGPRLRQYSEELVLFSFEDEG